MNSKSKVHESIKLYRTADHPCSYKDEQLAATVFVDPEMIVDQPLNSQLSDMGYRRSGAHLYRPDCDNCHACLSCRIPVRHFELNGRFKRIWNKNKDLKIECTEELEGSDAYALYRRYINARHSDGDMYPATEEQYEGFIRTNTTSTQFYKFYLEGNLVAVSVTDVLQHGLSAVYTFFDPDLARRSLGIYAILWQIMQAQQLELQYLFLGYWIKGCGKMQYKSAFRPLQMLIDGKWLLVK
ncbi:MAG: arginyltransferase [SAR86 cluster bacterium]|uniref:Aspartate/glutamate leucyltransferase n=1 Tax=SAR86 cluster bacterium TaxID=2030880 RepID=A0A2A5B3H2_9GAMM|nr:MAG: arginyltransferase [SAR86 cluster bacterium]